MRKSIDSLHAIVEGTLKLDSKSPSLFLFCDRRYGRIKALIWEGDGYALNRKPYLETYLEDGRCSFSNNDSENAIRPFCVGHRNWLFSDTPKGAHAGARVYTMVEMAKAYHLNVEAYLAFLLKARPSKDMTDEELAELTPWSETARANCAPAFT